MQCFFSSGRGNEEFGRTDGLKLESETGAAEERAAAFQGLSSPLSPFRAVWDSFCQTARLKGRKIGFEMGNKRHHCLAIMADTSGYLACLFDPKFQLNWSTKGWENKCPCPIEVSFRSNCRKLKPKFEVWRRGSVYGLDKAICWLHRQEFLPSLNF